MGLTFQYRSTQLTAWNSNSGSSGALYSGIPSPTPVTLDNSAFAFGGKVLNLNTPDANSQKGFIFPGMGNGPSGLAFSLLVRIVPKVNGGTSSAQVVFCNGFNQDRIGGNLIFISGNSLSWQIGDIDNNIVSSINVTMSFVQHQATDLFFTWDGTTGAGGINIYQDGTLLASAMATGTWVYNSGLNLFTSLGYGLPSGVKSAFDFDFNEVDIWSGVVANPTYPRTTFIPAAEFDGQGQQSSPGVENVRNGTTFYSFGVLLTGTLRPVNNIGRQFLVKSNPTPGQTLIATQGDAFTLDLIAYDQTGTPHDLTDSTFSSTFINEDGSILTIDNSAHTANPDQITFKGWFTMYFSGTQSLKVLRNSNFLTKVTQSPDILQFHGTLQILSSLPS